MSHSITRYFTVSRSELVYLKCIVEAHEGLITLHTIKGKDGIVEILIPSDSIVLANELIKSLCAETGMKETAAPEGYEGFFQTVMAGGN